MTAENKATYNGSEFINRSPVCLECKQLDDSYCEASDDAMYPMSPSDLAVGIDLGTTLSCVAVYKDGKVEVIANEFGSRTTRSCVAFTKAERLFGDTALNNALMNPENVVFDIKRLIGRRFDDPELKPFRQNWPFNVTERDQKPLVQVNSCGEIEDLEPEEIFSMLLANLKKTAENFLKSPVNKAVISVPVCFNSRQRQSVIDSAKIAGLRVPRIINETTAAAIAYGSFRNNNEDQTVMIFDLGGGHLSISILSICGENYKVKSTTGYSCGGEDFTNRIVKYAFEECLIKHKINLSENKRAMRQLKAACEKAKHTLSTNTDAKIDISYKGDDYTIFIDRTCFEKLNSDFSIISNHLQESLNGAKLVKTAIDEIILVGGSSRIPRIQQRLQEFFDGKKLNKTLNFDEAVASGAAICAVALISREVIVKDISPFYFEVRISREDSRMCVFPSMTEIPCEYPDKFKVRANRLALPIHIGLDLLAEYVIPDTENLVEVDVIFVIDADGISKIHAEDNSTGRELLIDDIHKPARLTENIIARMIQRSEQFTIQDKNFLRAKEAKMELESVCIQYKNIMNRTLTSSKLTDEDKKLVLSECNKTLQWLYSAELLKTENYQYRIRELENVCVPIISRT